MVAKIFRKKWSKLNEIYLLADIWWNLSLDGSGVGEITQYLFHKLIKVAEIPRAAEILRIYDKVFSQSGEMLPTSLGLILYVMDTYLV